MLYINYTPIKKGYLIMSLYCSKCFNDSHSSSKAKVLILGSGLAAAVAPSAPSPTKPPGSWGTTHSGWASCPGMHQTLSCLTLFKFSLGHSSPNHHMTEAKANSSLWSLGNLPKTYNLFTGWVSLGACEILDPWPGVELMPPAVEVQNPNHWTTREFPQILQFKLDAFPLPLPL